MVEERCSAYSDTGHRCRAKKLLTHVAVTLNTSGKGLLVLPETAVIQLCRKHLVYTDGRKVAT